MDINKKVAILMSTYNGEKYIEKQLESIFNQTYKNIEIIVRDDESKDNTMNILEKYKDKIKIIKGKNKGFVGSFFELLKLSETADYYSFADQDDIWEKDKIENAVKKLEKVEKRIPVLYCTNYKICNEKMEFVSNHNMPKNISFTNSLVECIAPGMTMVINSEARKLLLNEKATQCYYHDWWIYMLCSSLGKVIYDNIQSVNYRRHQASYTKTDTNFIQTQIWRIKQILNKDYFIKMKKQMELFKEIYGKELKQEDAEILELLTKNNIKSRIKKCMYGKPFRNNLLDELIIRICFLFNIV